MQYSLKKSANKHANINHHYHNFTSIKKHQSSTIIYQNRKSYCDLLHFTVSLCEEKQY